jgi:membrane associated rhomboid family serine protease
VDRLLARLERRFGKYAIENLTMFLVGGTALVFVLALMKPRFVEALTLDLTAVKHGQVWRLITYLFIPERFSIWFLFALYVLWMIGKSLESEWGAFKYNAYYFLGMIGTTLAAVLVGGGVGNTWLNLSLFFAFATLFPSYEFLLFFVLPVKVKWLGLLSALGLVFSFVVGSWAERAAILAATGNYFLFFGGHLWGMWRGRQLQVRQAARRTSFRASSPPPAVERACAICGAREEDGADLRVCTCEKCGGRARTLCLPHARSH